VWERANGPSPFQSLSLKFSRRNSWHLSHTLALGGGTCHLGGPRTKMRAFCPNSQRRNIGIPESRTPPRHSSTVIFSPVKSANISQFDDSRKCERGLLHGWRCAKDDRIGWSSALF